MKFLISTKQAQQVKNILLISIVAVSLAQICEGKSQKGREKLKSFRPYVLWSDTEGNHINAHGGGIMFHNGVYYFYGEAKDRSNVSHIGIQCYRSTDLYNWKNCGTVLKVEGKGSQIQSGSIMERPKVIYNKKTKKFVLWFHLEVKGVGYKSARTGLAVSDSPIGPFKFLRSYRPNLGQWPLHLPKKDRVVFDSEQYAELIRDQRAATLAKTSKILQRDMPIGQMSRDMTLFVDDDGKAYHIHSSERNKTLHISELSDDYLSFTTNFVRVLIGASNEAPAICKHDGKYYMLSSGCSAWKPNAARSAVADSIMGPWKSLGNPCQGINSHNNLGAEKTYGAQSTYLLPVAGKKNAFIAMFDVWRPHNQTDSRYLWLPAYIENGKLVVEWQDEWDLNWFDSHACD